MHPYIYLLVGVGCADVCSSLAFLASLFSVYRLIQHCYFDDLSFQLTPDGLVSHLGRGSELSLHFSAFIVALDLHFQAVFD